MPLVHLDDDDIDEVEAPRERILKPSGTREEKTKPARFQNTPTAEAEKVALASLERAIQNGASAKVIEKAQIRLEEARAKIVKDATRAEERAAIEQDIARRKIAEASTAMARKGAAAVEAKRNAREIAMRLEYRGLVVSCFPAQAPDSTIRLTTMECFRKLAHWFAQLAHTDAINAGLLAQNKTPAEQWSPAAILARAKDDLRVPLANGCATIETVDDAS